MRRKLSFVYNQRHKIILIVSFIRLKPYFDARKEKIYLIELLILAFLISAANKL